MAEVLFDRFEIIDTLKKDQHTSVYLANHIYLGKKIILKTLSTDDLPDKTILDRFKREAKILATLDHPNLIKVLDFGTKENQFYISFEYFEANNLRKVIKEKNLDNKQKTHLAVQLFNALDAAHSKGIIHRDIKPENILVNNKLELKIADFGLALFRDDHLLTHKASIVGTPGYMSPEQIRGESLTSQTDLFSAGTVLYELYTSVNPFIGRDINETVNKILNFSERDLSQLSLLPADMQNLLKSLLQKNRSKRLKSALEALVYLNFDEKKEIAPIRHAKKKLSAGIIYISAAVILAISVIGIFMNYETLFNSNQSGNQITEDRTGEIKDKLDEVFINGEETENNLPVNDNNEVISEDEPPVIQVQDNDSEGRLFVEVNPWSEVFINDKKIDTTPLESYIPLLPGKYDLKLIHPDFPSYHSTIEIKPNEAKTVKINFADLFGFLDCQVFPWGEIYINGEYKNITPLQKPIVLEPGEHNLVVKNPAYNQVERKIKIAAKETLSLRINFAQPHEN